jgi:hypothetical protein
MMQTPPVTLDLLYRSLIDCSHQLCKYGCDCPKCHLSSASLARAKNGDRNSSMIHSHPAVECRLRDQMSLLLG